MLAQFPGGHGGAAKGDERVVGALPEVCGCRRRSAPAAVSPRFWVRGPPGCTCRVRPAWRGSVRCVARASGSSSPVMRLIPSACCGPTVTNRLRARSRSSGSGPSWSIAAASFSAALRTSSGPVPDPMTTNVFSDSSRTSGSTRAGSLSRNDRISVTCSGPIAPVLGRSRWGPASGSRGSPVERGPRPQLRGLGQAAAWLPCPRSATAASTRSSATWRPTRPGRLRVAAGRSPGARPSGSSPGQGFQFTQQLQQFEVGELVTIEVERVRRRQPVTRRLPR